MEMDFANPQSALRERGLDPRRPVPELSATQNGTCALILGAGWSKIAGLPLTNELFDRVAISMPGGDRLHYELVRSCG